MRTWHWKAGALGAVIMAALSGAARSEEEPRNQLTGIVVYKDSGEPVANVFVAMIHGDKGYLYFDGDGLRGGGETEKVLGVFTKRNGKHFCDAVTDRAGRFSLTNFAGPDEAWHIAAADPERGWALRLSIHPREYAEQPLRLELEPAAHVVVTVPDPPDKLMRTSVLVSLAPSEVTDSSQAGATDAEELAARITFRGPTRASKAGEEVHLGPLPPGHKYRVTASVSSRKVPYDATLFARTLAPAAGATEKVSLAPVEGVAVTGRVTSSEDKPLAKVNVTAHTADGLVIGALTDEDGQYTLRGVPAGTHDLRLLRHAVRAVPG